MRDFFGNEICVGDTVAFNPSGFFNLHKGEVVAFTPARVRVKYRRKYRNRYSDILTLVRPENVIVKLENGDYSAVQVDHNDELNNAGTYGNPWPITWNSDSSDSWRQAGLPEVPTHYVWHPEQDEGDGGKSLFILYRRCPWACVGKLYPRFIKDNEDSWEWCGYEARDEQNQIVGAAETLQIAAMMLIDHVCHGKRG